MIRKLTLLLVLLAAVACSATGSRPTPTGQPLPTPTPLPTPVPPAPATVVPTDLASRAPTLGSAAPVTPVPPTTAQPEPTEPFVLTSPVFAEGDAIPARYTCDGADDQLPLSWSGAPEGTFEFALIQHDPDAGGFVHWVVVGIPADATSLEGSLPAGARAGTNDFGRARYNGPCPPSGNHTYVTTLFALSEPLDLPEAPTARQVRQAATDITLGQAQLRGTYRRT